MRKIFSSRIKDKKIWGDEDKIFVWYLAIIIKAEIHDVRIIRSNLIESNVSHFV